MGASRVYKEKVRALGGDVLDTAPLINCGILFIIIQLYRACKNFLCYRLIVGEGKVQWMFVSRKTGTRTIMIVSSLGLEDVGGYSSSKFDSICVERFLDNSEKWSLPKHLSQRPLLPPKTVN